LVALIFGASHTGKTLLAQKILEKYKFPYLSIDHLKMGLIRSGNTDLTPEDDEKLTGYLWPIVREMIKTAIENNQNLTVEGCYIPFSWRKDFDAEYLKNIKSFCLAMTENYIRGNFSKVLENADVIEKRLDASLDMEKFIEENIENIRLCEELGENCSSCSCCARSFLDCSFSARLRVVLAVCIVLHLCIVYARQFRDLENTFLNNPFITELNNGKK
jgi:hypothetical protein